MPLQLSEVTTDEEFGPLVASEFDAYETPDCKLKELFFPIIGSSPAARDAAIAEAVKRQTHWHRSDPSSTWVQVIDSDTCRVAGAACWHIYDTDPYAAASDDECDWWPEGEDRIIANGLMGQLITPRTTYMRKPHVCVGSMLVKWGVEKADEKGLDIYIDATDIGMQLYRAHGFVSGERREFTMQPFAASKRRDELEARLVPFEWWPALRPAGGKYEHGQGFLPWEE